MGTTGAQYMSYERYGKTAHKGAFGSSFIVAGTALKTSDLGGFSNARLDLFGPDLAAFMKRAARGFSRIGAFGEEMPNIENRIELASDKDEFGMPLGRIIHSYDDDVPKLWEANFAEGLAIAKAAGAKEMWSGRGNIPTIHLMGGRHRSGELGGQQLRADPRDSESLHGGSWYLLHFGRVEPDLHDLRPLATRCGAAGDEVEHGRGMSDAAFSSRARRRPHCGSMPAARTISAICLT
jgi:hypothetical protein